jgi:hypothetical protein
MKKIILSAMLMAFAVAVNAADNKATDDKEKAGCCSKAAATATAATAETKGACCSMAKEAKATCPLSKEAKETVSKPVSSPKGSEQAKK